MITIHIITSSEPQAAHVAEWLLRERLVYQNVDIDYQDTFVLNEAGKLDKSKTYKLQARTKALLFNAIEDGLRAKFGNDAPFLYSTPIVGMDAMRSKDLIDKLMKV
ncbi:MAG: hypothetical protein ACKVOR_14100 [Flavobacteriales bacterium]